MEDLNFRKGDAKTAIFGSEKMLQASPVDKIPDGPTTPEIAYQMVKDETFAQTQPRLNLATFVTTYMDDYATKLSAIMVGSSETTFYVLAVYFGAVGISKLRYALLIGLLADFIGILAAIAVCTLMF